jgi:hypothetical protein
MEIAGIPTVILGYSDQITYFRQVALMTGCPNTRFVAVPRIGHADEMVPQYYDNVIKALTSPLTAKEKEAGLYAPPAPARTIFEGTYDEAQDYLQQTTLVETCRMCPIAKYTDGAPVIIPTEEKVAVMLTGTSHKATESIMSLSTVSVTGGGISVNKQTAGQPLDFGQGQTATVEKVAICAVMAGCKPQYMPVALAIAQSGGGGMGYLQTSSQASSWFVVSGPIAKEIGMNPGQDSMDVGNQANVTLGRLEALIPINFGGQVTGVGRSDSGNAVHEVMFAEDLDGLPQGWVGFNQESTYLGPDGKTRVNYTAKQSVLGKGGGWGLVTGLYSFPGYYRSLNMGTMGLARTLGVEGKPGYYNWMEAILPIIIKGVPMPSAACFILHVNLAQLLKDYGFQSKTDVYKWMYSNYTIPVKDYYNSGYYDFMTNSGTAVEGSSGKPFKDLVKSDPNYQIHPFGYNADGAGNCIIVADSFADEHWYYSVFGGRPSSYPIDTWR